MKQASYNYIYDGSFFGLLCCFYRALKSGEIPIGIASEGASLIPQIAIETDEQIANTMITAIKNKIGAVALNAIRVSFLSAQENSGILGIKFLSIGFSEGERVTTMLANKDVLGFVKMVNLVNQEAKRFIQFLRFSEHNGVLIGTIEPQNNVLPLLVNHFCSRFSSLDFLIYDKTNSLALIYQNKKPQIVPLNEFEPPEFDQIEQSYRKLFREFYSSVTIAQRRNEKCRASFMPKKYWKNMTEFMKD